MAVGLGGVHPGRVFVLVVFVVSVQARSSQGERHRHVVASDQSEAATHV
jgi:hypothetical protein